MELVKLDDIKIGDRFRNDPGNISDLVESIKELGLGQPIIINDEGYLIAGLRRFLAFKELGETSIPCRILDLSPEKERRMEADENMVRRDFTNSEIYAVQQYFHETESKPKHTERDESGKFAELSDSDRSEPPREKTAKATGKSTDTVSKINQVMEAESKDPLVQKKLNHIKEKIDEQSVDKSYKEMKDVTKPKTEKPDPEFLVEKLAVTIKRQEDGYYIFSQLHEILGYPQGHKILFRKVSLYNKQSFKKG